MKKLNKWMILCILILGSLISVKEAKAYTFNISTTPCTNNQGCNATGCGYYGQTTYFNLWDSSVGNTMKSVTLSIYKDGNYDIGDSRSANNYMNWMNMGFTFYNTGKYTYHFDGTCKDGSTFYGDGEFYIYDIAATISSSPSARYAKLGTSSTFSISVSNGSHLSYQWGYNYDGSTSSWYLIDGATSSSYTIPASSMTSSCSGRYYFCRVSNYGNDNVFSTPAKLTVYTTISYNANGGKGAPSSVDKNCGTSATISSQKPTKEGYGFLGWSTSSIATSANPVYAPGSKYSADENLSLYAVWKKLADNTTPSPDPTHSIPTITPWTPVTAVPTVTPRVPVTAVPTATPRIPASSHQPLVTVSTVGPMYQPSVQKTAGPITTASTARVSVSGVNAVVLYINRSVFYYQKVVQVSWNKSPKADGFYIYRKTGAGKEKKIADVDEGDKTTYIDKTVKGGESYTYRILPYTESSDGEKTAGSISGKKTVSIGNSLKLPKAFVSLKGSRMTLCFKQAEGKYYETQYRWNGAQKWKNQSKMKGGLKKNIVKRIKSKGFYLRVRTYDIVNGRRIYSKWSASLKVK